MDVLVPIDGSEGSFRALAHGVELVDGFGGELSVVHVVDAETEASDGILERAREFLAAEGSDAEPELLSGEDLDVRPSNRVGEAILGLVAERGYDHVVMGHHGAGAVERAVLGSAAETVVRADEVPVTVLP
jgi:nucleotide-binding universal stress UspA family protein